MLRSNNPRRSIVACLSILLGSILFANGTAFAAKPNIIVIMADDLGYGDMSCHGNKFLNTRAIDRIYSEGIRLTDFHVSPTGAPTRAALMTGRYPSRTGVWHTMMGRSLLRADEKTAGDIFAAAGYRTGIFGKWHLGDNYPFRPVDRGFRDSLVHAGGGITQTPDYWGNSYMDPILLRNGKLVRTSGYCTDVFFKAAMRFIEQDRRQPFFVCIPTNAPHAPYQITERYCEPFRELGVEGALSLYYGMIANLDENIGKLLDRLDELQLTKNTIVVFLSDNGTTGRGRKEQLAGSKGSAYEGGHRVPCFIRWPGKLEGGFDIDHLTAHIDILPTLMELCILKTPEGIEFDGRSMLPLLLRLEDWNPRTLFVQSHCIENPQEWRQSAVMTEKYRLIDGRKLYDIEKDPTQTFDIGPENPKIVGQLRFWYEEWYKDVSKRFDEYCPIVLGSPHHNPARLSCFDWHGPNIPWTQSMIKQRVKSNGFWVVEIAVKGRYRFTLREQPNGKYAWKAGAARVKIGETVVAKKFAEGATRISFDIDVEPGETKLQTWIAETGGTVRGAYYVDVELLDPPQ